MSQCILWLSSPLNTEVGSFTTVAAILENLYDDIAHIRHSIGIIRLKFDHILIADDVGEALYFVDDSPTYVDLRGLS